MPALLEAAHHWLRRGMPIAELRIVGIQEPRIRDVARQVDDVAASLDAPPAAAPVPPPARSRALPRRSASRPRGPTANL